MAELYALAGELGLTALIEVHAEDELAPALALNPPLVGINNRDLYSFGRGSGNLPSPAPACPSRGAGGGGREWHRQLYDVARLQAAGLEAFLVGRALMRATDL